MPDGASITAILAANQIVHDLGPLQMTWDCLTKEQRRERTLAWARIIQGVIDRMKDVPQQPATEQEQGE